LPNLAQFEGAGVYYGATFMEAQLCRGEEVIVVGGGNAAGQAAVFLAQSASRVHMLVRSGGLAESMSRYLVRRSKGTRRSTCARTPRSPRSREWEAHISKAYGGATTETARPNNAKSDTCSS
jgi:thioredoxin reductase